MHAGRSCLNTFSICRGGVSPLISNAGRTDHGHDPGKTNLVSVAGCLMLDHAG
jgi:hypothetical protein